LCAASSVFSVVSQSMHASVTETPYCSLLRSAGIACCPACRLLSSISPTIEVLPSAIWCTQSAKTSGCKE
jgi:hypothetical protein